MRSLLVLVPAMLTGIAVCQNQVALPTHAATYNGFTRGFNFTAATSFSIVALELPSNAYQAGDTAGFLVRVNGAVALWSIGNSCSMIATNIPISIGDVVDVMGNWSPEITDDFTAHNSYGTGAFPTMIEGVPHTLTRTGWQWDIGNPSWVPTGGTGAYLAPTSGQLGRINMYTSTVPLTVTPATCTRSGIGCVREWASFHELFPANTPFDLANTALTMIPNGTGGYTVVAAGAWIPVGSIGTSTPLTLADNAEVNVPFTIGSFPGWTGLQICSNGFVSKAAGNGVGSAPSVATLLSASQTSFRSWHNFNPALAGSGPVRVEESAAVTTVTWDGVYTASSANANWVQFQFYATGAVTIAWGAVAGTTAHLVGYSPGGANAEPPTTDLSALGSGALLVGANDVNPLALATTARPLINTSWPLNTLNVPATAAIGIDVFGLADPGINDLAFLGMPGCGLRASLDVLLAWLPSGSTHAFALAIPNNASLIGAHVHITSAVFQNPPVNAFGAITSNGIDATIGDF